MSIRIRMTTKARQWTRKETEAWERSEMKRQRQLDRDLQRRYWAANPPGHVEALLIDSKGFSKTYALEYPPQPMVRVPQLKGVTITKMMDAALVAPNLTVIEFERRETITDPQTGAIKQIVYRERPS